MNLFDILSAGKRSLNEENVSSFLAWILDPRQSHGCGRLFLERLLIYMGQDVEQLKQYLIVDVLVEDEVSLDDGKKRFIDILIDLRKGSDQILLAIENKIRGGSADKFQLKEEYEGLSKKNGDKNPVIYFLYLTPNKSGQFNEAFSLLPQPENNFSKTNLTWNDCYIEQKPASIVAMLRDILQDDLKANINPLSADLKFVLKSFIVFAENDFRSQSDKKDSSTIGTTILNYKGRITGIEEVRKLSQQKTSDIFIGFMGGINSLTKESIEKLENRPYKWDDNDSNGNKTKANWIPITQFLDVVDRKVTNS